MRFVSLVNSTVARLRRGVTQGLSFAPDTKTEDMEKDPGQVVEALRQVMVRVNKLEAAAQPEGVEFEVQLPDDGSLVELPHQFKTTAVRWYVVGWFCGSQLVSPNQQPVLVYDPSSTPTSLFLRSYVAGRAIIRVEQSQANVEPGQTIDGPGAPLGRMRNRITVVGTASTPILTVPVPDNSYACYRSTLIGKSKTSPSSYFLLQVLYFSGLRTGGGIVTNLATTAAHSWSSGSMSYTYVVSGSNIQFAVQCTAAGQTVDWDLIVEPIHTLYRDGL